jgi:hypothetical protein
MTADYAPQAEPGTTGRPVPLERLDRVARAARCEPAAAPEDRAQEQPVGMHQQHQDRVRTLLIAGQPLTRCDARRRAPPHHCADHDPIRSGGSGPISPEPLTHEPLDPVSRDSVLRATATASPSHLRSRAPARAPPRMAAGPRTPCDSPVSSRGSQGAPRGRRCPPAPIALGADSGQALASLALRRLRRSTAAVRMARESWGRGECGWAGVISWGRSWREVVVRRRRERTGIRKNLSRQRPGAEAERRMVVESRGFSRGMCSPSDSTVAGRQLRKRSDGGSLSEFCRISASPLLLLRTSFERK